MSSRKTQPLLSTRAAALRKQVGTTRASWTGSGTVSGIKNAPGVLREPVLEPVRTTRASWTGSGTGSGIKKRTTRDLKTHHAWLKTHHAWLKTHHAWLKSRVVRFLSHAWCAFAEKLEPWTSNSYFNPEPVQSPQIN